MKNKAGKKTFKLVSRIGTLTLGVMGGIKGWCPKFAQMAGIDSLIASIWIV